jgi:hypothetical protein
MPTLIAGHPISGHRGARRRGVVTVVAAAAAVALSACLPPPPPPPPPPVGTVTVMGPATVDAGRLVAWFRGRSPQPGGAYGATVPVETLAQLYIQEGAAEGVRGDVAFIQGILETGWFRFGGSVPGWMNNFAGIGATDTNPAPAAFPDARTGVRAQIQHLRAYGDAGATTCTVPPLHRPCVDPRFHLVSPKGKAPTWNQMGNGNWATSSTYASSILRLHSEALAWR